MALREPDLPPGAPPRPDNQGNSVLCSAHALNKSVVNGFDIDKFYHKKLDFSQETVNCALVNVFKENKRKYLLIHYDILSMLFACRKVAIRLRWMSIYG